MLLSMRWLQRLLNSKSKARRAGRANLRFIENLESRQLLTTIFSEGFEGAFPGTSWTVNTDDGRKWDDNSVRAHTGSWSGFSADLASNADQSLYINNLDTTFTRTVDLSDFRNVSLSWWRYLNTEAGFDTFNVSVFKAGVGSVSSTLLSGNLATWTQSSLAIPESLWGQDGVTVQFRFHTDSSVVPGGQAGVWIDDISMDGTLDPGFPVSNISVPTGSNLRLNQFGDISGLTGNIATGGEVDTYGVGVDVAGNYTITVTGAVDSQLRIYDQDGNAITGIIDATGGGGTETVTVNRPATGDAFYFRVGGFGNATGSYSISVNGPSSTPTAVTVPAPTYSVSDTSSINFAGDRDYYSFTAPLDTTSVTITLDGSAGLDTVLTLLNASGDVLATRDSTGGGGLETLSAFATTPGQSYVLMVSGFSIVEGDAGSENYSYTIDFAPDNVGNPPSVITVPAGPNLRLNQFGDISGVNSNIGNTLDFEIFGFGVETGGSYTISASGAVDAQLRIYDQSGNAVTAIQNATAAGGTETYTLSLVAGQACYFVVGGVNNSTGNFTVSVNGPTETLAPTIPAAPNYFTSGSSTISFAGDRDLYALTAPTGTNVLSIVMNPTASLDGVISLFNSAGVLLQQRDTVGSGGAESLAGFAVTAGQTYTVMFSGYSMAEGNTVAESYSYSFDFGPDLSDPNVAPTIPAGQVLLIAENSATGTAVGTVVANDANSTAPNNVLTYEILGASPSNPFTINSATGLVTYSGPGTLNHEAVPEYTVSIRVTDGGGLSATQQVTVSTTDVNEAPSIGAGQVLQILENTPVGAIVGAVLASDPDTAAPNSTLTYSIIAGVPSNPFAIDPTTGQVTVANPAALNFEATPSYDLQVRVTDAGTGNLTATQNVTVNLIDGNDPPSIAAGQIFSIDENSAAGIAVGVVAAIDPDTTAPNNTLTYSITAGNTNSAFSINSVTGTLTVNNPAALDFETGPSFTVTINATDGGALSANQDVIVNLLNVNEAPTLAGAPIAPPTFVFKTNTPISVFPTITVKDPDSTSELASVVISISIPTGKKNFDVVQFASTSGLGSITDTVAGSTRQLTLNLNPGVITADVENFLRSVQFSTAKKSLKTATRTFQVTVTDIHGAISNVVNQNINVRKK